MIALGCVAEPYPQYRPDRRRTERKTTLFAVLTVMMGATPAIAGTDLAKSKKCLMCHAADKELKGPSFQAIAKLYKGTDKAEAKLAEKIRKGGAEHWGQNVMPSTDMRGVKISDAEANELARWELILENFYSRFAAPDFLSSRVIQSIRGHKKAGHDARPVPLTTPYSIRVFL